MTTIRLKSDDLLEQGLLMEVDIMPSIAFIQAGGFSSGEIPTVRVKALFDTGAKVCAVDRSVIEALQVVPYKVATIQTPLHRQDSEVYLLTFRIPGEREYFPVTAVLADLSDDVCKAIIGRDMLQYCTLVYDGPTESGRLIVHK